MPYLFEKDGRLELVGTTSDTVETRAVDENSAAGKAFLTRETVFEDVIAVPMHCNINSLGVIVIENNSEKEINEQYIELVESIAVLFATSITLQKTIDDANRLIADEHATVSDLQHIRAELTALIGDLCDYQQSFVQNLANAVDTKGGYKVAHSKKHG